MKRIAIEYLLGLVLGLVFFPLTLGLLAILPEMGWHFLTLMYILILVFQVTYYYMTAAQRLLWSTANFILNFILWSVELIGLEKQFGESELFDEENRIFVAALAALLWTTNKLLIDFIFRQSGIQQIQSRINLNPKNG